MFEEQISIRTEHFDGPMGLLLHLLQREEMPIEEIDINKITAQYLDYLTHLAEMDFDLVGDYLYMAATLVLLKSKACVEEKDINELLGEDIQSSAPIQSRADLIRRLEELQHMQDLGKKLWALPRLNWDEFTRPKPQRKKLLDLFLPTLEKDVLISTMMDFLQRQRRKYKIVKREKLSIKEKLNFLKMKLKEGVKTTLLDLLDKDNNEVPKDYKTDLVITFISLLELARLYQVKIFQNQDKGTIYVDVLKELSCFDIDKANGFDEELDANSSSIPNQRIETNDELVEILSSTSLTTDHKQLETEILN